MPTSATGGAVVRPETDRRQQLLLSRRSRQPHGFTPTADQLPTRVEQYGSSDGLYQPGLSTDAAAYVDAAVGGDAAGPRCVAVRVPGLFDARSDGDDRGRRLARNESRVASRCAVNIVFCIIHIIIYIYPTFVNSYIYLSVLSIVGSGQWRVDCWLPRLLARVSDLPFCIFGQRRETHFLYI